MLVMRALRADDIPFAMTLKDIAGWNQTPDDWRSFLSFRPDGCYLAIEDERPAGTVTTIDYQGGFGWVGMVLVHPTSRGRGIGTALLKKAIESLSVTETVKLDATPAGRRVYVPLGFEDEAELERRVRPAARPRDIGSPAREVRPFVEEDLETADALDREVFGRSRRPVLEAWFRRAAGYGFVREEAGVLRGYTLGRHGSRREHVGPLVARSFEDARALLFAALRAVGPRPILLDTFTANRPWLALLDSLGFEVERPFTRMYRGPNRYPGRREAQWAIAGPEVG